MPYAADGRISQEYIEGGIEISQEDYLLALAGILSGLEIKIYPEFTIQAPEDSIPTSVPVPEITAQDYAALAQQYLDGCAKELGYDNILTAITYAEEPAVPKFQQDGLMLRVKRSLVWAYCYEQLALVQSGARPKPTLQEFLSELQAITNEVL